uniref:Uncharacterized protein n=1 Tax=Picea glauca TaxID=3330 RepID=A0A117NIK5_PICGL|nr:hypothetical protein ABT39_MTgene3350 [Picea glauca]
MDLRDGWKSERGEGSNPFSILLFHGHKMMNLIMDQ